MITKHLSSKYFISGLFLIIVILHPFKSHSQFPSIVDLADTTADITIFGAQEHARAGYALASGDFNGDGYFDLFISSDGLNPLGGTRKGEFNIVWGQALQSGGTIALADTSNITRIFGSLDGSPTFCNVTSGDFNNDNYDDIVIGQPLAGPGYPDGIAYIILGISDFPDTLDLQNNPDNLIKVYGGPWSGALGSGICACDFNGDGYDEIVLSAVNLEHSETYIICGADSFPSTFSMEYEDSYVSRIIDNNTWQGIGRHMTCGDIDKDGYEDLLMSGTGEIDGYDNGIVCLLYGDEAPPDTILLQDTNLRVKWFFDQYFNGYLGEALSIGDINNDNLEDIIIGASAADPLGCLDCGEVHIYYDVNSLPDSVFVSSTAYPTTRIIGSPPNGRAYGSNILCKDFTGDGYSDIVIASRSINNLEWTREKIVIYYGTNNPPDSVFVLTDTTVSVIMSESHGDRLARAITSSDYDDDSISDLVLGAYGLDEGGLFNYGRVYLFYGASDLTNILEENIPKFILKQNYPNPFSISTSIQYNLSKPSPVSITIYNILGQRVAQITKPFESDGPHSITWNGLNDRGIPVSSGIYLYRLKAGGYSKTLKMIRIK